MKSKNTKRPIHTSAANGWFAHHLVWLPDGAEDVHNEEAWKHYVKVSPIALWADKGDGLEPVVPDNSFISPMQTGGIMPTTMNYAFIGVFHHDSYRMGDVVCLPFEYHPLEMLSTDYCKEGVSREDLSDFMRGVKKEALTVKGYEAEDRKKALFAKKMKLIEQKSVLEDELKETSILLEINESDGGVIL